jgi:choline kinase
VSGVGKAVILAAGMGMRMHAVLPDRPKGFLELGGRPIIERSLEQLRSVNVESVLIVTGYRAQFYEGLAERRPGVTTVRNEHYAGSGSMYSLYVARDLVEEPFLLLESDLVYETRALEAILACPEDDAILLSGPTGAGDEVYVEGDGGRVRRISKRREALGAVAGELVGISKVSPALLEAMCAHLRANLPGAAGLDYEGCISEIAMDYAVTCHRVDDLVWTEVDDAQHLARAQRVILPRLAAAEAQCSVDSWPAAAPFDQARHL